MAKTITILILLVVECVNLEIFFAIKKDLLKKVKFLRIFCESQKGQKQKNFGYPPNIRSLLGICRIIHKNGLISHFALR